MDLQSFYCVRRFFSRNFSALQVLDLLDYRVRNKIKVLGRLIAIHTFFYRMGRILKKIGKGIYTRSGIF